MGGWDWSPSIQEREGSELGSELTILASSELMNSELKTSEFQETLAEGTKGALHLGPERPRVYSDLSPKDKERNQAIVQDGKVIVQNVLGRQNRGQGNNARGAGAAGYGGAHNRVGNANPGQARQVKCYSCNGIGHIARNCTQPKHPHNSEYFKDKMLLMQAQENRVALDEEQLLFIAGGQDNAIDEDVDEQPTMFMANLSSADLVYDEAGPSYNSDILSRVHDHDHYQDVVCEHHEEHEMHDDVKPNYVVDSHANYTSDSNMIPYDQSHQDESRSSQRADHSSKDPQSIDGLVRQYTASLGPLGCKDLFSLGLSAWKIHATCTLFNFQGEVVYSTSLSMVKVKYSANQFYLMWLASSSTSLILIYCSNSASFLYEATSQFPNLFKIQISKLEYKFQDQKNSEDIFSIRSALGDFIFVVFVLVRNINQEPLSEDILGECVDWTNHLKEDEDYALMACNSFVSGHRVTSCSNKCKDLMLPEKNWIDAQREQLSDASIEIKAYTQGLKKVEAYTEPSELVSEPVVNESNVECQPKVWSDAPIIEEYESDSEDEYVSIPTKEQETPSFANQQVKTPRETVKNHLNHLIRDCDFHEKRMARKAELNNGWNNVQRVNKQNQFVPSAVLTRTDKIPVSTARASGTKNELGLKIKAYLAEISRLYGGLLLVGGIKREYSNARTPQQNGVAERKNKTLIEAARTMLADSFLPNTFWVEAVSTACYVLDFS
ncbi:integrase, catalytic region, zinc finger, CCHC-type containing protein [Tanacetum coccineum]